MSLLSRLRGLGRARGGEAIKDRPLDGIPFVATLAHHTHLLAGELPHEADSRLVNGDYCDNPECPMTKAGY